MTDVYESSIPQKKNEFLNTQFSDTDSNEASYIKSPAVSSFSSDNESISNNSNIPSYNNISSISRPLSRSSVTSGLSVTATKDGIEGKRVKRTGIPGYPLNLINKMYNNYASKKLQSLENSDYDDGASVASISSMIPQYSREESPNNRDSFESNVDTEKSESITDKGHYTIDSHLEDTYDSVGSQHDGENLDDYSKFLKNTSK